MRISPRIFGLLLLLASGTAVFAADKDKTEAPKEESVVPYDSKTQGALQVKSVGGKTAEWFDVLQNGKRAIAGNPPRLDSTVELAPGAYVVAVNHTERKVTIETGKKTILLTGELVVEGKGADWYVPYQGKERKLASNPPTLNHPTALFAGSYTVFVRVNMMEKKLGEAEVAAGRKTVLKH
jgi:hypothetical protein